MAKKAFKLQIANVQCTSNDELSGHIEEIEESLNKGIEELKGQLAAGSNAPDDVSAFITKLTSFENKIIQSVNTIKGDLLKMQEIVTPVETLVDNRKQNIYLNSFLSVVFLKKTRRLYIEKFARY